MRLYLALALILVTASTAAADPAAWKTSFDAQAVSSHHPDAMEAVVVVGGGEADDARDEAVSALLAAYRLSGRAKVVLDSRALGELGALADADIVTRAGVLPISHVAIVRIFAGAGGPSNAVVTVYDKAGSSVASFVATAGVALPARPSEPERATTGVSKATVDTVASTRDQAVSNRTAAKVDFNDSFIWFTDFIVVNGYGSAVGSGASPYQGVAKRPLGGASFYRAVGRDDLAGRYETRRNIKIGFMIGGAGVAIGGLVYALSGDDCSLDGDAGGEFDSCVDDHIHRGGVGIAISAVGILAMAIPMFVTSHPVSLSTRRQLALDHNARLRHDLSLDEDYMPRMYKARITDVQVTPYAAAGGGGLLLGGRF